MDHPVPVVLIHGIRLSGGCWQQQQRLLSSRTSIAPDLPGHGARRGEVFTLDAAVDAVTAAIDRVGGRAVVVGHSLGGYVAADTAARHPEKVAALVGFGCTLTPNKALLRVFALADLGLAKTSDSAPWSMRRLLRRALPAEIAEPVLDAGIAQGAVPAVLESLATFDPVDALRKYPGRTALVNGGRDHFRLGERRFADAAQNGGIHVVPGAGHFLPLTHGDVCAHIIEDVAALADVTPATTASGGCLNRVGFDGR
ncbi:alpha/beta fold hydrolase [Gordonia shandongensis]|uniref:alpha/beta fold hydrolase n=1 Tax=Gordonia shandongensis TaxID=376351 RepID=UPI00040EF9CC|nr:alpha/beta hydrolase [Gordonia shandongensis]